MNKLTLTLAIAAALLASTSSIARPGFDGQPPRFANQEQQVQRVTERMTERGYSQDDIDERISRMQQRMENHEQHRLRAIENLTDEERLERMTERLTEQGLSQGEIEARVTKMQERTQFRASLEGLSDEDKLEAIRTRLGEQGFTQEEIDEHLTRITDRMSLSQ